MHCLVQVGKRATVAQQKLPVCTDCPTRHFFRPNHFRLLLFMNRNMKVWAHNIIRNAFNTHWPCMLAASFIYARRPMPAPVVPRIVPVVGRIVLAHSLHRMKRGGKETNRNEWNSTEKKTQLKELASAQLPCNILTVAAFFCDRFLFGHFYVIRVLRLMHSRLQHGHRLTLFMNAFHLASGRCGSATW